MSSDAAGSVQIWGLHVDETFLSFTRIGSFVHSYPDIRSEVILAGGGRYSNGECSSSTANSATGGVHTYVRHDNMSLVSQYHLNVLRKKKKSTGVRLPVEDPALRWWEGKLQTNSTISKVIDYVLERKKCSGLLSPDEDRQQKRGMRRQMAAKAAQRANSS